MARPIGADWMEPGSPPGYRLYTADQIALATLMGTPLAGCWLMYRNDIRLGLPIPMAWLGLPMCMLAIYAILGCLTGGLASAACVVILRGLAANSYRRPFHRHRLAGGEWASLGEVLQVALCSAVLVALLSWAGWLQLDDLLRNLD